MKKTQKNQAPSDAGRIQGGAGARRIFSDVERRYIAPKALALASSLLESWAVPMETMEKALIQALVLGMASNSATDASTLQNLVDAVSLDPTFSIPLLLAPSQSQPSWVC